MLGIVIGTKLLLFGRDKEVNSASAKFIACDVGQGDAILIQYGSFQLLMDAGQTPQVLECLSRFLPPGDATLEVVVASHADSDHIGGFEAVFNQYQVKEVWLVSLTKKTADFEAFNAALSRKKEQGTRLRYLNQGEFFNLPFNMQAIVLSPQVDPTTNAVVKEAFTETTLSDSSEKNEQINEWGNDRSIVLKMLINRVPILLTGDIEINTEQALVAQGLIDKATILKVAHHGSKTSSTVPFLDKAQPEIAAISSGINNKYGHPSPEVIANLEKKGTTILRTDQLSHIVLEISGEGKIKMIEN
jgi:competence protein ComEC